MTDLVRYEGPAADLVGWAEAGNAAHKLAQALAQTQFAPAEFRGKPAEATAAILAGAEVGLSPIQALNSIYVVNGRPGLYARTMVALVQRAGHEVWTDKETPAEVTVCGRRAGSERVEKVTVSMVQAQKAGWTRNKQYETNPTSMLWARAASTVCRRVAADALLGIPYTAEELADEQAAGEQPVTVTVQRRKKAAPELPPPPAIEAPAGEVDGSGPSPAVDEPAWPDVAEVAE